MAATYDSIMTHTLPSATNTYTLSSIPQTYTDLVLVIGSVREAAAGSAVAAIRYNGDTGSNYSFTYLGGNGSTASSGRVSNSTYAALGAWVANLSTTGESDFLHLMNYSNTTTYKTTLARSSAASSATEASVALWRSTAAINSITLTVGSPAAFTAGSTFSLYGIKAA
jgi:hypothetical protein